MAAGVYSKETSCSQKSSAGVSIAGITASLHYGLGRFGLYVQEYIMLSVDLEVLFPLNIFFLRMTIFSKALSDATVEETMKIY